MPCGDSPARERRNDIRTDSFLPERARGTNLIRRLWAVLAQRAQWNQHGCRSRGRRNEQAWKEHFYDAALRDGQFEHPEMEVLDT